MPYTERTYDALEAEQNRLHLLRVESIGDCRFLKTEDTEAVAVGWHTAYLGRIPNSDKWLLQVCLQYDVDAYATKSFFFSEKPSESDMKNAFELSRIRNALNGHTLPENYTCFECGQQCFWLDNGGQDIYECAIRADDNYCGC